MSAIDLSFTLDDVYTRENGRLYMSGIQALVRLPMMQRRADRARGLSTAGLISGYRGSPLGAYDQQLWRARRQLEAHDLTFQPGLNEDLAATALWGAQMHRAYGKPLVDGVFGLWYGKGPGVDRSGDVFRNANVLGTSALGGVLALAGDDHAAQSSMFPHQTDGIFQSVMMPVLQPASVAEILSLGLAGFALSRFSGLWVGMKAIAEVIESAAAFEAIDPLPEFRTPGDLAAPRHGFNWDATIPWPSGRAELERRLVEERLPAALAWWRANGLDGLVIPAARPPRLLVVTVGKAHQDVMEALSALGLSPAAAAAKGVAVYKVAMSWPLETGGLKQAALGVERILVVEEKRGYVEDQLKAALYALPAHRRPPVLGKRDLDGAPLLPEVLEFSPLMVARALIAALPAPDPTLAAALAAWECRADRPVPASLAARRPFFCAGCPHNTSTRLPEGSMAGGGIGCHVMAISEPERRTPTFSQMGGEGLQWVGAEPYVETPHVFQNLGDGTYQHSGVLAVRAAVAARSNITFKVLYNDAVAMTGGQKAEGDLTPLAVVRQLAAEGVGPIVLVSDQPDLWRDTAKAAGAEVADRAELDAVQRRLRETPGVTAIVYEQTCASEKRRRRKRGQFPDPDRRLLINPRVCEGCGDCQAVSNCIAVEPLETSWGVKRRINQSACNKDFSCVQGFCPSFVEVEGARLPSPDRAALEAAGAVLFASLPDPKVPDLVRPWNIVVAGVGGTGVLTLGALLGAAAYVEGRAATTLDFTGLAQKNGAVTSQVRLAPDPAALAGVRVGEGEADLVLAADLVVAAGADVLRRLAPDRTHVALNSDTAPTADAVTRQETRLPIEGMEQALAASAAEVARLAATRLAEGLFGDATTANTLLLGFAWQRGWVPLSEAALMRGVEINGVAIEANQAAFRWGRAAAHAPEEVAVLAGLAAPSADPETLEALVDRLAADLTAYQDRRYAERFRGLVAAARQVETAIAGDGALAQTVARQGYRLMAYKDEYEVARLYSEAAFGALLRREFSAGRSIRLWLAPPLLPGRDPATGRPRKRRFGPWILPLLRVLAHGKALRGCAFDPFGWTEERREERALVTLYQADIARLAELGEAVRAKDALALAAWPTEVAGFGPVKRAAVARALSARERLWAQFDNPAGERKAA